MQFFRYYLVLFLLTSPLAAIHANGQASVIENQSSYLYVDASNGSDSDSGAATAPFKTVQAAINKANTLNRSGIGVKVIINPGTYRESVTIGGYNVTSAPLTVEAANAGTAMIDGSDVLTGWAQESPGIYSTSWTADLGLCAIPPGWPTNFAPIAQRAEMVFVDGIPLTQVMSYDDLVSGTFFADESADRMYISPDASTDMGTAIVEGATRRSTLSVAGRSNVVLRGLVFRHAANCLNTAGAAVNGSTNILVDSVQAVWNNWGGLGVFSGTSVSVQNSIASYNGGVGFMGNRDENVLFTFNESDFNNWRGAQAAFYDWAMGGTKLFAMRSTTVQNHFSYNNQAQGLWFDTDSQNITADNVTLSGNVLAALQIERNEGPLTVKNSYLCSSGAGANILTSQDVTLQNNTFYNNGGTGRTNQAAIFVAGQAGGIFITDWQTGQVYDLFTTGTVLKGNTIVNGGSGQFGFGTYLTGSDWTQFASTLTAGNNKWHDPFTTNSFKLLNGKAVDFAGWQSAVGTDYSSAWSEPDISPVARCTSPAQTFSDFSMDADDRAYTMSSGKAVSTVHVNSFGLGTVNLRLSGVPNGVTATLSQQSLVSGTVTITFTSSMAAVAQNAPITIWGTSGSRVHSITFYVQVVPAKFSSTVTWAGPQGVTYGTPLSATQLNAKLSVAGTCTYTPSAGTVLGAGTRTLTATCTPTDTFNYSSPAPVSVSLTVAKAPLTITASSPTVSYHSAIPTITPEYSGFVNGDSGASLSTAPTCKTSYTTSSLVSASPTTGCWSAVGANYSISYIPGRVTIIPAAQTITLAQTPASVAYGASAIKLSATATSGAAVSFAGTAGMCTTSGSTLTFIGAGNCTVTASQAGNANYAAAPSVVRTIAVNPAPLTITASSPAVVYGSPVPVITASYGGFVRGDTTSALSTLATCSTAYTPTSPVGSSPVTTCSGAASTKYSMNYISGKVAITPITATPVISVPSGTYNTVQSVTISASSGATIYYTTNGSNPTTSSTRYTGAISVPSSMTLKAIAVVSGCASSATATATYTVNVTSIDFSAGFIGTGGIQLNGKSTLVGTKVQLTDGGTNEAASAFFSIPLSITKFSTSFTIQQTAASGDGMMFVIQNATSGAKALGPTGSSLGYSYGPTQSGAILNSLGVKFDLYSNAGEGANSTGLYLSAAKPTTPALDLTSSGIDLHRGDPMNVQLTYDGTTLQIKIVDTITSKSYSTSWTVNIPQIVGGTTAYLGFTASTGGGTAIQQVHNWKF